MKKNELMNGDIVVLRSGSVAVVIGNGKDAYLLFKDNGFEFLDDYYDDDMVNEIDEDAIMQVFRPEGGFGFEGVDQEVPVYERDETWVRPTEEELAKRRAEFQAARKAEMAKWRAKAAEAKKDMIAIIAQAFYGNRTGTEIRREHIDSFILGNSNGDIMPFERVDRTIVSLPGSDNLVLIYNKYQEEERLETKEHALKEHNYVIKPLATIPELDLEIYSRCIVCRVDADGKFESLGDGDFEIWGRYLAN